MHDARRGPAQLCWPTWMYDPRVAMRIMRHADFAVTMEIDTKDKLGFPAPGR